MTKNILNSFIALFLALTITSCGQNSSTSTQTEANATVTLVADKAQVVADGIDGVTLTVTVKDATGAPLAQQPVILSVPPTFSCVHISSTVTDENGQVVLFISPLLRKGNLLFVSNDDMTATCLGVTSAPVTIRTLPAPPQITSSVTLVADKTQAIADGMDTVTFTATVKDGNGTPLPRRAISFSVPPGTNLYIVPPYSDSNGMVVLRLSCPINSLNDRVIDVTATSGGITSNVVSVTYTALQQVTPATVSLTSDKTTLLSDGIDRVKFTITATDSNGTPLPGQNYNLHVDTLGPFMWTVQLATNSLGQASSALECKTGMLGKTCPSSASFTATINGATSNAVLITISP